MSSHTNDVEMIRSTRNTARFFTEVRHISWVLLIATLLWGVWGFLRMPQRKDPDIPVRQALALCHWPGASSERVEERLTRRIEEEIAKNPKVEKIESVSRTGISVVYVTIDEAVRDRAKEFDDIKMKLDGIRNLPDGAGPLIFVKDFGDTAALMLTVATPKVGGTELALRARGLRDDIDRLRRNRPAPAGGARVTIVQGLPLSIRPDLTAAGLTRFAQAAVRDGVLEDPALLFRQGFIGVDGVSRLDDAALVRYAQRFVEEHLRAAEIHPDSWPPVVVRDTADAERRLATVAGDKYSYRELDDFTELISRTLRTIPLVSKVDRSGLLEERVYLEYSQEALASYGVNTSTLSDVLSARNITLPGGVLDVQGKSLTIDPSGEFTSEREIGEVSVPSSNGKSVYLRDLAQVVRAYASPPAFLNFYGRFEADGSWRRSRAVTLAVQMKSGGQIAEFGAVIDRTLEELRQRLPEDLVLARTSDQPKQVEENIHLFMRSLEEAIVLVVLVSLIGFWEWRSALLMALSIPITLAMTFGMMLVMGIDLQQVSIASLIIALGLLVDDPVVAGDAIKRELAAGRPALVAAWLGPTKLAGAIMYATVTNIVAYLPFLFLPGDR